MEKKYNQVYELLVDSSKTEISHIERELIISTVVTMYYRTTKWISSFKQFANRIIENAYNTCLQTGSEYFMLENERVSTKGKTLQQLQIENHKGNRPSMAFIQLNTALELVKARIDKDNIMIIKLTNDDLEFMTSDNPVCCYNPSNNRIVPFDQSNILSLPLDNKHYLMLMPYANKEANLQIIRHNSGGKVGYWQSSVKNYMQTRNAEKFVLGGEEALKSYLNNKIRDEKLSEDQIKKAKNDLSEVLNKMKNLGIL